MHYSIRNRTTVSIYRSALHHELILFNVAVGLNKAMILAQPAVELSQDNPEKQYCCIANEDSRGRGTEEGQKRNFF